MDLSSKTILLTGGSGFLGLTCWTRSQAQGARDLFVAAESRSTTSPRRRRSRGSTLTIGRTS